MFGFEICTAEGREEKKRECKFQSTKIQEITPPLYIRGPYMDPWVGPKITMKFLLLQQSPQPRAESRGLCSMALLLLLLPPPGIIYAASCARGGVHSVSEVFEGESCP